MMRNCLFSHPRAWVLPVLAAVLASSLGILGATAGVNAWTPVGPDGGGLVRVLAIDPQAPDTLYAGGYGGVFKSQDGGAHWSPARTGITELTIDALAVDPTNSQVVYAGSREGGGVFKSVDGGAVWTASNTGIGITTIRTLAVDPANGANVYAGTSCCGIYKSTNGGMSWTWLQGALPSTSVWAIVVDPSSPATVYAGTQTMGVYKSTNAGATWTPVNNGLLPAGGNRQLRALAIDPAATGTLYATTDGGVFKTVDSGAVWTASNGGLTNLSAQAIAVDPRAPSTVYIGVTFNGVQKSVDGGATWTPARTGLTSEVSSLAIDPRAPARVYAGTQVGIFATANGGQVWATANAGLANAVVQTLAVDPAVPTTLYAGTRYSGAHKSVDGGDTWTGINAGLSGSDVRVLTIDPSLPSRIYAGTGNGLYRSTDSGATWTSIEHGTLIRNISAIVVDPRTPSTLRVGTFFTGVFVSTDGGETWSTDNVGLPATPSVSGLAYGAGQLVASTPSNGMFIADAPGASAAAGGVSNWRGFMIGIPPDLLLVVLIFLFIVPMGFLVLAGASSGSPLGAVWMALTGAVTMDSAVMGAVPPGTWQALPAPTGVSPSACSPVKTATGVHGAGTFYVGGGCGVLAVTDGATKVTAMNAGMPTGLQVNTLAITPSGGDVYAGTDGGSVFRYTASGAAAGVQVVEYYNAALDHYFITWVAAEQANLDAGNTPTRWTRTGQSFRAYAMAQGGTSPVCRYYIPPNLGDSHFFGRGVVECAATGQNNPSFVLEEANFMHVVLPAAGVCPAGTHPVYRVFSNRPDANHRYLTDRALRDQMAASGWLVEGDGPDAVVMCAPS